VGRITVAPLSSLFSEFSLCYSLWYSCRSLSTIELDLAIETHHVWILCGVEELGRHHHLLLVSICIWSLALLTHQLTKHLVSAVGVRGANAAIVKGGTISLCLVGIVVVVGLVVAPTCRSSTVARPHVLHEVVGPLHCFSHHLLIGSKLACVHTKSIDFCLIHICCLWNARKHLLYSWIVGWLKHDSRLSGIHLINAEWSIVDGIIIASLLAHAVNHEESLVGLLSVKPKKVRSIRVLTFRSFCELENGSVLHGSCCCSGEPKYLRGGCSSWRAYLHLIA